MKAFSKSTTDGYNTYIKKWVTYCESRNIPMSEAINSVKIGNEFLTHLFDVGKYSYSAINNARCALSKFINTGNSDTFGKQIETQWQMRGMFRERPQLPRYTVTFNPQIVLEHLRSQKSMTLKQITYKIATLLCFVTGQRDQSINEIDTDYKYEDEEKMVFYIPTVLKTTTPRYHLKPLTIKKYPDKALCVAFHIDLYLKATEHVRGNTKKLLLSIVPPFKEVTTTTVARWVKETLSDAGINTKTFSSHSTRSSSTSTAKERGLSMDEIRKAAGWTNGSTFARFYERPIVQYFGEHVLPPVD